INPVPYGGSGQSVIKTVL
ncbi:hypothetical protein A2U01_0083780, partial [Trifolium medium]|nr:hypothetical protein [Trifolium medium]